MKKAVVEDCLVLDINLMLRQNLIQTQYAWKSILRMAGGSEFAIKRVPVCVNYPHGYLKLNYSVNTEPVEFIVPIDLTYTSTGKRIWRFQCPIQKDCSYPYLRKVQKLYLPPGGKYFGCRHCYDLSYESRQNWNRRKRHLIGKMAGFA